MNKTQIQITIDTRDKLNKIKIVAKESYDEVINRLLKGARK